MAKCAGIREATPSQAAQLQELLDRLLPESEQGKLGCAKGIKFEIELEPGAVPVSHRIRRQSPAVLKYYRDMTQELFDLRIIERCASPWFSAPVLVKRNGKKRLCIDYRSVNLVTKKRVYPIPHIGSMLVSMRQARYNTLIDLNQAYHQVPIAQSSRDITAFAVLGMGQFRYRRMSFGLTNAPAFFQDLMNKLFGPECAPYVGTYLDDIYIATATFEEHIFWLEHVIKTLEDAGLTVNAKKCNFCVPSVIYLGFRIVEFGLRPDNERVQPIFEYPAPTNLTQLRIFLGMIGWYARFISDLAEIKLPLNKLLHKGVEWVWGKDQQKAFEKLKEA